MPWLPCASLKGDTDLPAAPPNTPNLLLPCQLRMAVRGSLAGHAMAPVLLLEGTWGSASVLRNSLKAKPPRRDTLPACAKACQQQRGTGRTALAASWKGLKRDKRGRPK